MRDTSAISDAPAQFEIANPDSEPSDSAISALARLLLSIDDDDETEAADVIDYFA